MRRRMSWGLVLGAGLCASVARADYKAFAHTYPHFTQPEGNLELEWWVSAETQALSRMPDTTLLEHRVELEYGLTDRWDVSLYQVFDQAPGQGFTYQSVRVETRYQLTRKFQLPVDLLGYLELERPADLHAPNELEAKLIATRDFGRFFIQTNWIAEVKLIGGERFGYELALNAGVGFEVVPAFRVGVEALFDLVRTSQASNAPSAQTFHLGPSVSIAKGRLWCVLTPAFRVAGSSTVDDRGQDLRFGFIVGAQL